ncbi:MAG: hypothetical protein ACLGGX_08460 [Bdellovibrionia bacterium]
MKTDYSPLVEHDTEYSLLEHIKNPTFSDYVNDLSELEIMILRLTHEEEMDEVEIAEALEMEDDGDVLDLLDNAYRKLRRAFEKNAQHHITKSEREMIAEEFLEEISERELDSERALSKLERRRR